MPIIDGTAGNDTLNGGDMSGNNLANNLDGGLGNDALMGAEGIDTLLGGSGNDTLDGGWHADKMAGGTGNDVYVVNDKGDVVTELVNASVATSDLLVSEYVVF